MELSRGKDAAPHRKAWGVGAKPLQNRSDPPHQKCVGRGREDVRRFFGAAERLCNDDVRRISGAERFCRHPEDAALRHAFPNLVIQHMEVL